MPRGDRSLDSDLGGVGNNICGGHRNVAQEQLSRRQEAVALVAGRLAVFGDDSAPRQLLAARLLSHAYSHGPAVEAAVKEVCRWTPFTSFSAWPSCVASCLPAMLSAAAWGVDVILSVSHPNLEWSHLRAAQVGASVNMACRSFHATS